MNKRKNLHYLRVVYITCIVAITIQYAACRSSNTSSSNTSSSITSSNILNTECEGTAISDQAELEAITLPSNKNGKFYLANDIDLDNTFVPINSFSGTLNGCGRIISNLNLTYSVSNTKSDETSLGLIRTLEEGAIILQLGLESVSIVIDTGGDNVGSLVGNNYGIIWGSYARGTIQKSSSEGSENIGGLVGINNSPGVIEQSYAHVEIINSKTITANVLRFVGGLVGKNHSQIINTFSTGGENTSVVFDSTKNNQAGGIQAIGGLVGKLENKSDSDGDIGIKNSYSIANVFANENAGGLLGEVSLTSDVSSDSIANNYATGTVLASMNNSSGGLIGALLGGITTVNAINYFTASKGVGIGSLTCSKCTQETITNIKHLNEIKALSWDVSVWSNTHVLDSYPCLRLIEDTFGSGKGCPPNVKTNVQQASICSDVSQPCSAILPLAARGGTGDSSYDGSIGEIDILFDFHSEELRRQFRPDVDLRYSIISGNPEARLQKTLAGGVVEIFALKGYRIDNSGKLYVADAWLFGRNRDKYDDPSEYLTDDRNFRSRQNIFNRIETQNERACGNSSGCPSGTVYDRNSHLAEYTFGRTDNDSLVIRVEDVGVDNGKQLDLHLTVYANPEAVRLSNECSGSVIDKWSCQYARELIPVDENLVTTAGHRNSLPDGLLKDKSEYDLVANIEFDDLAHTKKYFNTNIPHPLILEDGKLVQRHERTVIEAPNSCGIGFKDGYPDTGGKFEPGLGYLEFNIVKYPNLHANGGNILLWSRYGLYHDGFIRYPPKSIFNDYITKGIDIARSELAKIGFLEIDFFERWSNRQEHVYSVTHVWPRTTSVYRELKAVGEADWFSWIWFTANERRNSMRDISGVFGIEMTPRGLRLYQDGVALFDYRYANNVGNSAKYILMHGIYGPVDCSTSLEDERIEIDYIRLYKPRSGYNLTED